MSDNVFRDDWNAAIQRADALAAELERTKGLRAHDARRVAQLEAQLAAAHQAIQALQATMNSGLARPEPPVYQSSQATMALVLGILSFMFFPLLGPFAWHYGNQEMIRIQAGLVDPRNSSAAQAGRILGIISTVLLCASVFFIFLIALVA